MNRSSTSGPTEAPAPSPSLHFHPPHGPALYAPGMTVSLHTITPTLFGKESPVLPFSRYINFRAKI